MRRPTPLSNPSGVLWRYVLDYQTALEEFGPTDTTSERPRPCSGLGGTGHPASPSGTLDRHRGGAGHRRPIYPRSGDQSVLPMVEVRILVLPAGHHARAADHPPGR